MASVTTDRRFGVNAGQAVKVPCKAATTTNITLSGEQTIDGISCVDDERVLVKNQTDATENGVYLVDTSTWTRAPDWDGTYDIVKGSFVKVTDGSANIGFWEVTTDNPIVIDTTEITFALEAALPDSSTTTATIIRSGTTSITANTTYSNDIIVYPGGKFDIDSGVTLTLDGNVIAGVYEIFEGDGDVKFGKFTECPAEWFGVLPANATGNYARLVKALKAGTELGAGICLTFDSLDGYTIDNAANTGISLDADNLPDTSVAASNNEELPVFKFKGRGANYDTNNHASLANNDGYLLFTGTGDGVVITGGTRKWRGHIHMQDLILRGTSAGNDGLSIDYASRWNTFERMQVREWGNDGIVEGANSGFSNFFENVRSQNNTGWGWILNSNANSHKHCGVEYNEGGGVKTGSFVNSMKWEDGMCQFNMSPQIQINGTSTHVTIDGIYLEGQDETYFTPNAGTGEAIIELNGAIRTVSINARVVHGTSTAAYQEQYFIKAVAASTIFNLDVNVEMGMRKVGATDTYVIGGTGTVQSGIYNTYYSSGADAPIDFETDALKNSFMERHYRDGSAAWGGILTQAETDISTGTTINVDGVSSLLLSHAGATDVTNFTNGEEGQTVDIRFQNSNITLKDLSTTGSFSLPGSADLTPGAQDIVSVQLRGSTWYCKSYSNN